MHHFVSQIIIQTVLRKRGGSVDRHHVSPFVLAKGWLKLKLTITSYLKDFILIVSGIAFAAFGLESFLLPNQFIDGGVTGISLLLSETTSIPLYLLLLVVNVPFLLLGYYVIGRQFAVKSVIAILGLALTIALVSFPSVTSDKLLVAVFGGFFLGVGIGLSVRGGGVLDGTEVLAIYMSKKLGVTIGDIILIINIFIFGAAAYLLSIETALYSILAYLAASRSLDFVIEGIEEYTGVTIISVHHEIIRERITNTLGRGVTIYKGKRGYYQKYEKAIDVDIIYTVVTRLEISKLKTEIEKIDPNAFVIMHSIKDTKGGMIKKRPLQH